MSTVRPTGRLNAGGESVPRRLPSREPRAVSAQNVSVRERDGPGACSRTKVDRRQRLRSCGPDGGLMRQRSLLRRLVRGPRPLGRTPPGAQRKDRFSWRPRSSSHCPVVGDGFRSLYAAGVPDTTRRFAVQALQDDHPQWGWCLGDEERLVRRGVINIE